MADYEQQLIDAAWPYWEAEGEIARRFFEKATGEDHIFYLRAQLWKELNPVDGFFNGLHRELAKLVDLYPKVDKEIDRHQYHFLLTQLAEEFNHYVVLADIFEHLMGRPISAEDTVQLSEEKNSATSGAAMWKQAIRCSRPRSVSPRAAAPRCSARAPSYPAARSTT